MVSLPACYLKNTGTVERGEGLLSSVIAQLLLWPATSSSQSGPAATLAILDGTFGHELNALRIETLAVQKRPQCWLATVNPQDDCRRRKSPMSN